MAAVPQYQPNVAERPILQQALTVRATPDDMGAAIGRGIQGLGQGVQQAADAMAQLRGLEANAEAKDALNQFSNWEREARLGEGGFATLQGKAAIDARADYERALTEQRRLFGQKLRPDAANIYIDASEGRLQSALETTAAHTIGQTKVYVNETSAARQEMLKSDALAAYNNPGKLADTLVLGRAEIAQNGALNGWDAATIELKQREFESLALNNVVLRMAQDDPINAAQYVLDNADKFTPETGYALTNALQPMVAAAAGRDAAAFAGNNPAIAPGTTTSEVVRHFEGFSTTAYNDPQTDDFGRQRGPDVYRAGYGSDTITRADGSVERVTAGMTVTREDADRDLERRLGEFQQGIVADVGPTAWGVLDKNTQAALTSVAYNYGSLPASVAAAVATGDRMAIASAVEGLSGHNGGINAKRRAQEADLIRNGSGAGVQFSERVENLLGQLPPDRAIQVREAAAADLVRQNTAAAAQARAEYDAYKGGMELKILTGDITSEETIISDPTLQDDDKASLIRVVRSEMESTAGARSFLEGLLNDNAPALNPFIGDDQTLADKSHEMLISSLPANQQGPATAAFIRQTGMIPKDIIGTVQMGLASQNADEVLAGLKYAAMLADAAPAALTTIANGSKVNDAADLFELWTNGMGYTPEVAAQRYIDSKDPERVKQNEALLASKPIKDALAKIDADDVSALYPSLPLMGVQVGENDAAKVAMVAEYRDIVEQSILDTGGDLEAAKELASVKFQRRYGPSGMTLAGQGVVTRLPPEKTYQPMPDGSYDYISNQLREALTAEGVAFDDVRLVTYEGTDADFKTGADARYQVYYQSGGQWQLYNLPFTADHAAGLDAYNAEQQQLMVEREAERQSNLAAEQERWPEGRNGPERFSNGELYYGIAKVNSPMGRAVEDQKRRNAEAAAAAEQWQADAPGQEQVGQLMDQLYGTE